MQKYQNNVTGRNGDVVIGGSVLITLAGTSTPATIYSDAGVTPVTNPLTTDANGYFEFYAADGTYDISVNGTEAYTAVPVVDALAGLAGRPTTSELAASGGAELIGALVEGTVQAAIDARPTSAELAASGGAGLVGYDGGTSQDVLDNAKTLQDYTALRAYTGRATGLRITTAGVAGTFWRDASDTTSADNGGTIIVDASSRRWKRLYDGPADIRWFGADNTGIADSTTPINNALAAHKHVRAGSGGVFKVDGTLLMAVNETFFEIQGGAEIQHTPSATKGINITGARCSITGGGIIRSLGTRDAANVTPTYAVIWAAGSEFRCSGMRFIGIPKIGIRITDAGGCSITGNMMDGLFPNADFTGTNTAHFCVAVDPDASTYQGQVVVSGNTFKGAVTGLSWGNFGAANDNRGLVVTGNLFTDCHDHGIYAQAVNGATITGNTFDRCCVAAVIQGTGNVVSGNSMVNIGAARQALDRPGISIRDAVDCVVTGNTVVGPFPAAGFVAIGIDSIDGTEIKNNIVSNNAVYNNGAFPGVAIRLGNSATEVCNNNVVSGNNIKGQAGTSSGLVVLAMKSTFYGQDNSVTDNVIDQSGGQYYCANLSAQRGLRFSGNALIWEYDAASAITALVVSVSDVQYSVFSENKIACRTTGTNVTLRGFSLITTGFNQMFENQSIATSPNLTSFVPVFNPLMSDFVARNSWDNVQTYKSAAPTTGTWKQGDVVFNTAPVASGTVGWVCTTAGTPGTWKTFGAIAA